MEKWGVRWERVVSKDQGRTSFNKWGIRRATCCGGKRKKIGLWLPV